MNDIDALPHQRSRIVGAVDSRVKGWSPLTPGNCMAWYEARKENYADSQVGALFHDWSGNGFDLSSGGSGTFHSNAGKPYIDSTAGNYSNAFPARGGNPTTMVIAATNGNGGTITMGLGSGDDYLAFGRNQLFTWGNDPGYTDITVGPLVMFCTYTPSTVTLYKNADSWASWNIGLNITSGICLLNWKNYDRACWGRAYGAAVWSKVLTSDERLAAYNYFSQLY